jgi:hypothetical protein
MDSIFLTYETTSSIFVQNRPLGTDKSGISRIAPGYKLRLVTSD